MNFPPHKSQGMAVMTSDYVDIVHGVLRYSDEAWVEAKEEEEVKAEIAKYGEDRARKAGTVLDTSKDGYFNVEKCIPDFKKVKCWLFLRLETIALVYRLLIIYELITVFNNPSDLGLRTQGFDSNQPLSNISPSLQLLLALES